MSLPADLLLLLSTAAYVIVGIAVGVRLVRLSRRGVGRFAERMLGIACLTGPGLVAPCLVVVHGLSEPEWIVRLSASLAQVGYAVLCSVMVLFTRQCFRPDEAWARWLMRGTITLAVFAAAANIGHAAGGAPLAALRDLNGWAYRSMAVASIVGQVWTGLESFVYYARMRRRRALGLADPVVTNRFLLWGCVSIGALVAAGAPFAVGLLGVDSFSHVPTRLAGALATIFSSVCLQLAFLPPDGYLRWIHARAAAQSESR